MENGLSSQSMSSDPYQIRPARAPDLPHLPAIERAAAQRFATTPYAFIIHDEGMLMSLASFEQHFAHHHIWVAVDRQDQPVGFAVARPLDGYLYLHEIDVHPDHGRRGLGRRLIAAIVDWARSQQVAAVTLSTFDDVAWNAPYYTKLGFRPLTEAELGTGLKTVREHEAADGLDIAHRVCMILPLFVT